MKNLILLINKFIKNDISNKELKELENLLEDPVNLKVFKETVKDDYLLKTGDIKFVIPDISNNVSQDNSDTPVKKLKFLKGIYKYAAIFILLLGVTLFFRFLIPGIWDLSNSDTIVEKKIELELDDGTVRFLAQGDIDTITTGMNNSVLGFLNSGQLRYIEKTTDLLVYNTLKVPYGKQFQLRLSDGTIVHLNAGSSLRYPVAFGTTNNRKVFLEGEAFFDVTKDSSRPFLVETHDVNIEVLGTRFNVSSYTDDDKIVTTLQEGAVKVYSNIEDNILILVPNEQSSWNRENKNHSKTIVNTELHTSWIKGSLVFKDANFSEIIKKLQRRYDVNITNKNMKLNDEKFTAKFDVETIEQILFYFSTSHEFKFKSNEKTIIIE